jgi:hypothetical protein
MLGKQRRFQQLLEIIPKKLKSILLGQNPGKKLSMLNTKTSTFRAHHSDIKGRKEAVPREKWIIMRWYSTLSLLFFSMIWKMEVRFLTCSVSENINLLF